MALSRLCLNRALRTRNPPEEFRNSDGFMGGLVRDDYPRLGEHSRFNLPVDNFNRTPNTVTFRDRFTLSSCPNFAYGFFYAFLLLRGTYRPNLTGMGGGGHSVRG